MPAIVTADSQRLILQGIPSFTYRDGRDSLVLAMNAAAASFGREDSYARLKGRSGLAFRLMFHQDWHRFTPDALSGYDHTPHLLAALGVSGALIDVNTRDAAALEESREVIHRSLSDGYPVLGMHLMDYEDWGVIAGITAAGMLLCQTPHNETSEPAENKHWPSMLLHITAEDGLVHSSARVNEALHMALRLHATARFGEFYSGKAAYKYWIAGLRDSEAFQRLETRGDSAYGEWVRSLLHEDRDNFALDARYSSPYLERAHVNAWRMESLIDARASAAEYLNQAAEDFSGKARSRLLRTAEIYAHLAEHLSGARQYYAWEWNLIDNPWTQENRNAQAGILEEALALENVAAKEIRAFLSKKQKA